MVVLRAAFRAAHNRPMTTTPLPAPLSVAARPELTGGRPGRRAAAATASPARPPRCGPGASTSPTKGYAVEVPLLPGHGTTLAGPQQDHLARLVRRADARASTGCWPRTDAVVVGGLSMGGALALRLAADHGRRRRRRGAGQPVRSTTRTPDGLRLLPLLKRIVPSFPGIVNDIKKPGQTSSATTGRRCTRPTRCSTSGRRSCSRCCRRSPQPLLLLRSTEDHVVDPGSHRKVARERVVDRGHREDAAEQLPRGDPRQRRPDRSSRSPRSSSHAVTPRSTRSDPGRRVPSRNHSPCRRTLVP